MVDGAVEALREAVALSSPGSSKHALYQVNLGSALVERAETGKGTGDVEAAVASAGGAARASSRRPRPGLAYSLLGKALLTGARNGSDRRNVDEALEVLKMGLRAQTSNPFDRMTAAQLRSEAAATASRWPDVLATHRNHA